MTAATRHVLDLIRPPARAFAIAHLTNGGNSVADTVRDLGVQIIDRPTQPTQRAVFAQIWEALAPGEVAVVIDRAMILVTDDTYANLDTGETGIWQRAVTLGAEHVAILPDALPWLTERVGAIATPPLPAAENEQWLIELRENIAAATAARARGDFAAFADLTAARVALIAGAS